MLEETADIVARLGVPFAPEEVRPVLRLPEDLVQQARAWSAGLGAGLKIGVNLAAGVPEREAPASLWKGFLDIFTERNPAVRVVLFTPPGGKVLLELKNLGIPEGVMENPPHKGILGASALLNEMDVMVSTDTSIPHLCSALGRPVVVLYHCEENSILWAPYGVLHKKVISPAGGHAAQDPMKVVRAVEEMIGELRIHFTATTAIPCP
jgi:ADP-heptose:LPS heptosyltransferase